MPTKRKGLLHVENVVHHQLVQHSITLLRVALGAVFCLRRSPAEMR